MKRVGMTWLVLALVASALTANALRRAPRLEAAPPRLATKSVARARPTISLRPKLLSKLTREDLKACPVWDFADGWPACGDPLLEPFSPYPGRAEECPPTVYSTEVTLADGTRLTGFCADLLEDRRMVVFSGGGQVDVSIRSEKRSPAELKELYARLGGRRPDQVFPLVVKPRYYPKPITIEGLGYWKPIPDKSGFTLDFIR